MFFPSGGNPLGDLLEVPRGRSGPRRVRGAGGAGGPDGCPVPF